MDRREFIETGGTTIAAASLFTAPGGDALLQPPPALSSPPVLQNLSADGVVVFWRVSGCSTGWVEYGSAPDALTARARGSREGLLPLESVAHRISLTGLQPGTTYYYRIATRPVDFQDAYHIHAGEPVYSAVYSFTTLRGAGASGVRFAVINDTHENPKTLETLMSRLGEIKADLTFWNGDIFNDIRSETHLADQLLAPHAGNGFAAERPLFVVRGNHDVRGFGARLLDRFVSTPNGRYYYQFRQGPVAFLVLDSGEDKEDSHPEYGGLNDFTGYRAEQREWLEEAIREETFRSAPFRVVLIHIPLLGNYYGAVENRAAFHHLLVEARADLVISGHTHRHAYHPPTPDRPYAVLIGGGPDVAHATAIYARADDRRLEVTVEDMTGKELGRHLFTR